jgi:hypothetical protein
VFKKRFFVVVVDKDSHYKHLHCRFNSLAHYYSEINENGEDQDIYFRGEAVATTFTYL